MPVTARRTTIRTSPKPARPPQPIHQADSVPPKLQAE